MIQPRHIDADGKQVIVKLMDDSWLFNQCVGGHPVKPKTGVVWKHSEHCARLSVPGDELPAFSGQMRDTYGNCAAVAWCDDVILGHIVFLPRAVARQRQATGWEHFGPAEEDESTLVVINLCFCSLSGHEFRRRGVGRAMVDMMLDWASDQGWSRVEVYDATGGLFPLDWYDDCIPPRPFWEKRGFAVFGRHGDGTLPAETRKAVAEENPRNSEAERYEMDRLLAAIDRGEIDPEWYGYRYDLRREL